MATNKKAPDEDHKANKVLDRTTVDAFKAGLCKNALTISNSDLESVECGAFESMPDLEYLSITNNLLEFIHINAFGHLPHLRRLILSFNSLTVLENKGFMSLLNLEELEITDNQIKLIYPRAFYGLKKLKRLILANNQINHIYPETFDGLIDLNLLILSYNKLKGLHVDTFKELVNLKRINLMNNQLKNIPENIFKNCSKLTQITLSKNKLNHLSAATFRNLDRLERFFGHSNKLKYIETELFRGLKNMTVIDLGSNKIKWIEENAFDGLVNLEALDLSCNRLQILDTDIFSDLKKMSEIFLNNNSIDDINSIKMGSLVHLKTIHLDFNHIIHIEPDLFANCSTLLEAYCNTISPISMKHIQHQICENNRAQFLEAITFICSFTEPELMLNSSEACQKLAYVSYFCHKQKLGLFQAISDSDQNILIKNIAESIGYLFSDYDTHIEKFKPFYNESDRIAFKVLEWLTTIAKNWSYSASFCKSFAKYDGVKHILAIIDSDVMRSKIPNLEQKQSKYSYKIAVTTYSNCLSVIHNLITKPMSELKQKVVDLNGFNILIKVSEHFENISEFRLKSFMCLGNIFVDKDASQLIHIKSVIGEVVGYTGECVAEINSKNLERFPVTFEDQISHEGSKNKSSQRDETMIIQINESYFYLIEFLDVLYNFAVSDEIKFDIYETFSMKKQLKMLILYGNNLEKDYGLKLLWQLCYDQRCANHVINDTVLVEYVRDVMNNSATSESLVKKIKGLFWLLFKENALVRSESKLDYDSEIDKHIMISCESKSRQQCLDLKKALEDQGYKIRINAESIYGPSLESMASAIENSLVVIMCMTQKYKESNYCRLEAEYTAQLKKPFISLAMDPGYRPDGWLGLLLGARTCVDFCKLEFSMACSEVLRNLAMILKQNVPRVSRSKNNSSNLQSSSLGMQTASLRNGMGMKMVVEHVVTPRCVAMELPPEASWTEEQVDDWFEKLNIDQKIVENLTPCNGPVMYQLHNMLHFNPEFFYGSLKPVTGNSLKDLKNIAIFCLELKALFDKE